MMVGEHQALVGVHDYTGAQALALSLPVLVGQVEKVAEEGIAEQGVGFDLDLGDRRDVHHRRRYRFQHRGQTG